MHILAGRFCRRNAVRFWVAWSEVLITQVIWKDRLHKAEESVTIQSKVSYRVCAWRPTSTGWLNCAVRDHYGSVSAVRLPSMVDISPLPLLMRSLASAIVPGSIIVEPSRRRYRADVLQAATTDLIYLAATSLK